MTMDSPPPAPTGDAALFGAMPVIPTDPATARKAADAFTAAAFSSPDHPLVNAAHAQHALMVEHQRALYAAAYPESVAQPPEAVISATGAEAVAIAFSDLEIGRARLDGQPLQNADLAAGAAAFGRTIEALGLPTIEAKRLAGAVNNALRDGPNTTTDAVRAELGEHAEWVVGLANKLLDHLETRGVPGLREALDRTGAGNDAQLLRRLAAIARAAALDAAGSR